MNNKGYGKRNAALIVLCVLLAALLAGMMYMSEQEDKARQAEAEDLQAQAKQYEEELTQIKNDLKKREESITYVGDTAGVMVGFAISDENDIDYVELAADSFEFQPILIIDCCGDMNDVKALIDAADAAGREIMLTAETFSENAQENAAEALSYMEDVGARNAGVFLLRNGDYNAKNTQVLIDSGFVGYTRYNQSAPMAGVTEEGSVYFDYSYIQSMKTTVKERLKLLCLNKTALILVFDTEALHTEKVTEEYVEELIDIITGYEADGECKFKTTEDVTFELLSANKTEEERRAEYEEYAAEKQERIDELEKIIKEIYQKLG